MQTTKQQLLALLKRAGSVTVEEAAGALTVASMTARQHLVNLEKDGLVRTEKVRRATGRPHFLYLLTPKGEEMFPRRYDLLAQILLDEVGQLSAADLEGLGPDEKRSLLIRRTADRLADRFRFQVEGPTLEHRVAAVSDVLQLIGGFAEWFKTDTGYEIRDYNCVFSRLGTVPLLANGNGSAHQPEGVMRFAESSGCEWHVRLLTRLLHWPVRHEVMMGKRVDCCRYLIDDEAAAGGEGMLANA